MIYNNVELYNVQDMIEDPERGGFLLSRLPAGVRSAVNSGAQYACLSGSGVELRFRLVGEQVTLVLARDAVPDAVSPAGICEVYQGGFQGSYHLSPKVITTEPTRVTITRQSLESLLPIQDKEQYPYDPELIRVLLPYDWANRLVDIEGDVAPPLPGQVPKRRYLAYGSSITHGGSASVHSAAYASQLARKLGLDLINLGMAGSAQMDAAMAEYIAGRNDWDIATLEMGVNVTGWPLDRFRAATEAFVSRIADAHPDQWIFCTDIFRNYNDYKAESINDGFRDTVREVVQRLNRPKLIYLNGYDLLTTGSGLSSDGLHPSDSGFAEIAEQLHRRITAIAWQAGA
ncbi:SGNH/GDSL hydrolase family protein [Paenibacillus tengchongensis]|uniref:SGNH/GDSL hydrolase family protein n=1 Tax=Paenibacillus tengchongensis TaxID=2608684 RepID=UPI00124D5900|nr:SGNH/GDSL hydrolase family protein [Paenibacillus tengchongensis]